MVPQLGLGQILGSEKGGCPFPPSAGASPYRAFPPTPADFLSRAGAPGLFGFDPSQEFQFPALSPPQSSYQVPCRYSLSLALPTHQSRVRETSTFYITTGRFLCFPKRSHVPGTHRLLHLDGLHSRGICIMAEKPSLLTVLGFTTEAELFKTPWEELSVSLRAQYLSKAITEGDLLYASAEWLVEKIPSLGLGSQRHSSPTVTTWCRFLASLGCLKQEVVTTIPEALKRRGLSTPKERRKEPHWGIANSRIFTEYNKNLAKAERKRLAFSTPNSTGILPAPVTSGSLDSNLPEIATLPALNAGRLNSDGVTFSNPTLGTSKKSKKKKKSSAKSVPPSVTCSRCGGKGMLSTTTEPAIDLN